MRGAALAALAAGLVVAAGTHTHTPPTTARMDNPATQKPDKTHQTRSQPRQAKSPPHCAAGSTESKVTTTTATPTPEALAIAVIFKDFAIDHTPDGWPAVKQMHLNAAAAELERQHAEIEALRALLSKKPIIGSGRTQYDRLIKAARNIEQSVNSSSSWGRIGPDDSDIAWQEFKALASDVCTLIDSPPDNEALKAERARSGLAHRKAVQEAVAEAVAAEREACEERVVSLFEVLETPYLPDITRAIRARGTP